jgi:hypothetical protein
MANNLLLNMQMDARTALGNSRPRVSWLPACSD